MKFILSVDRAPARYLGDDGCDSSRRLHSFFTKQNTLYTLQGWMLLFLRKCFANSKVTKETRYRIVDLAVILHLPLCEIKMRMKKSSVQLVFFILRLPHLRSDFSQDENHSSPFEREKKKLDYIARHVCVMWCDKNVSSTTPLKHINNIKSIRGRETFEE